MWEAIASIASVVGTLLGYVVREWVSRRKWRRIESSAQSILNNPHATNDPEVAVVEAMRRVNAPRIKRISMGVKPPGDPVDLTSQK